VTWLRSRSRGRTRRLVDGWRLSDGPLRSHVGRPRRRCLVDGRPRRRCLVDGRLSDRGLGSRSMGLGSRSVRGWFRCGPLLRWCLLSRCRWAGSRSRLRRLRNWIGLGCRVRAGRSHPRLGCGRRYRFGWWRHCAVRRARLRRAGDRPRGGVGAPSRHNVGRCAPRLSLWLGDLRRSVDGHRRKLGCGEPG
jgi:hypothetical protein